MIDQNKIHYHLSHPQKRIWYIEQIYPNTPLHNIGGPVHIKGAVDFDLLEAAINIFIKRHDGLRLQLTEVNGEVKQYVNPYQKGLLDYVDFSVCRDHEAEFNNWVYQKFRQVFKLYDSPLFYFAMFKISTDDQGYFVKFHHLIADGWTMNILTEQICDIYAILKQGKTVVDINGPSYLDYLELERKYLGSERFYKDRQFWNEKFRVLPDSSLLNKNIEHIKNALNGRRKTYHLPEDRSSQIKSFCNHRKISLNTFFAAAILIYRFITTQQTDMIIGIPVINRSGRKEKQIVGMFTSSMPFRITFTEQENISRFIEKVNRELLNCYFHQKYPYNILAGDLELNKKGYHQLFDICVNYYNTRLNTRINGFLIENIEFYNGNQLYALQLVIKDWTDRGNLTLDFDYRLNDYTEPQIDKLYHHLNNIIDQFLTQSDIEINRIEILSDLEKQYLLYDYNNTSAVYPQDKTIHQLFEIQAQKNPDKTAISFGNQSLTYRELNKKANQLARFLRDKGVGRESIVGLCTTHSLEMVIGILGILKAGGAYLPIDPDYPAGRIHYLLDDSQARVLLVNYSSDMVRDLNFNGEIFDLRRSEVYPGDGDDLPYIGTPDNLVYVIYTSGSTGQPKGVMIEHRGLVNYSWWANKVYVRERNEVFALYSSLAFDLTVTSIFTPLTGGHQIHITVHDGTDFIIERILSENKATIVKLTPAHLALLQGESRRESSVRCFIVGGEDLKTSLAAGIQRSFGAGLEIYNEYGPTETVVGCMIHRYNPESDQRNSVPIGIPADNVRIYLLDKWLKPVPPGADGEIYISGDGVARGYLNKPGLTAEKFVINPFDDKIQIPDSRLNQTDTENLNQSEIGNMKTNSRMYKTGDLARFLDNGKIEYRGRADFQVKIHGNRIELGEIEKCLLNHPEIKDAVVMDRDDALRGKYLCAYYTAPTDLPVMELRKFLSETLPEYMIPLALMRLPELPLTINGKINRSLLPEPQLGGNSMAAPEKPVFLTGKEALLAGIIAEILNVEQVRATDNFFQLGGDSIKAIQIAAKLKGKGFKIKVKEILAYPVIAEIAARIESGHDSIGQGPSDGLIELTPIISWFFGRNFKNPNHWNQSILLNLASQVEIKSLHSALNTLIRHHDSLRINYNAQTGKLYYNPAYLTQDISLEVFDLTAFSATGQDERINRIGAGLKSGFDLGNGLLFKSVLFECGPRGRKLLLTAHHIIVDGVSWRIILNDLSVLLKQAGQGIPFQLPPKTASYQKWTAEIAGYCQNIPDELYYWEKVNNNDFQFPVDHNGGEDSLNNCRTFSEVLPAVETGLLLTKANSAYNTKSHELLIMALALTISDWTKTTEVVFELEGHGREELFNEVDVSRTVGWFTSVYPVRLQVDGRDLTGQIKSLKEQLRGIPSNGFNFGVLKYLTGLITGPERKLIRFNYLGVFDDNFGNGLFDFASEKTGTDYDKCNHLTCLLEINALIINRELRIEITYSHDKFTDETIQKFGSVYLNQLCNILQHCRLKERIEFTPADFDTAALSQAELDELLA